MFCFSYKKQNKNKILLTKKTPGVFLLTKKNKKNKTKICFVLKNQSNFFFVNKKTNKTNKTKTKFCFLFFVFRFCCLVGSQFCSTKTKFCSTRITIFVFLLTKFCYLFFVRQKKQIFVCFFIGVRRTKNKNKIALKESK